MYAIRIALMPIAICVPMAFSGCVNLDSPPPIPKSHRVVVNFTNQGLSVLSDIPMGLTASLKAKSSFLAIKRGA